LSKNFPLNVAGMSSSFFLRLFCFGSPCRPATGHSRRRIVLAVFFSNGSTLLSQPEHDDVFSFFPRAAPLSPDTSLLLNVLCLDIRRCDKGHSFFSFAPFRLLFGFAVIFPPKPFSRALPKSRSFPRRFRGPFFFLSGVISIFSRVPRHACFSRWQLVEPKLVPLSGNLSFGFLPNPVRFFSFPLYRRDNFLSPN